MDGPFDIAFASGGRVFVSVVWDNRILTLARP